MGEFGLFCASYYGILDKDDHLLSNLFIWPMLQALEVASQCPQTRNQMTPKDNLTSGCSQREIKKKQMMKRLKAETKDLFSSSYHFMQ